MHTAQRMALASGGRCKLRNLAAIAAAATALAKISCKIRRQSGAGYKKHECETGDEFLGSDTFQQEVATHAGQRDRRVLIQSGVRRLPNEEIESVCHGTCQSRFLESGFQGRRGLRRLTPLLKFRTVICVASCAAITACGGSGGSSSGGTAQQSSAAQPPSQALTAPASVPSIIIDAEGDSLIWGLETINGVQVQTKNTVPVVLQADLESQLGTWISIRVDNRAMPGSTTEDSLYGVMPYYAEPFATRVVGLPGQIVLADYAINDSRVRTTDEYDTDLTQWVAAVRAAGKIPVLEEPNPVCDPSVPNLDAYVSIMRTVAQTHNVLLIEQYDYIKGLSNWQSMLTDCIHPNDDLYAIKAQRETWALAPVVLSLVKPS